MFNKLIWFPFAFVYLERVILWFGRDPEIYNQIEKLFPLEYFYEDLFTYPDAKVTKSVARDEFLWLVVLVWREVFT